MVLSNQRAMQLCSLTFGWTWLLLLLFSFGSFLGQSLRNPSEKWSMTGLLMKIDLENIASRYQQCFNNTLDWLSLDTAMAWKRFVGRRQGHSCCVSGCDCQVIFMLGIKNEHQLCDEFTRIHCYHWWNPANIARVMYVVWLLVLTAVKASWSGHECEVGYTAVLTFLIVGQMALCSRMCWLLHAVYASKILVWFVRVWTFELSKYHPPTHPPKKYNNNTRKPHHQRHVYVFFFSCLAQEKQCFHSAIRNISRARLVDHANW